MNQFKGKRVRSGAWLWLRKGQVPADCEEIRLGVGCITRELVKQFCGDSKPSAAELILIDRIGQMLGFAKLIEREAWRNNPIGTDELGKERLAPGLGGFYVAASNGIAKALRELRELSDRPAGDPPIDLSAYMTSKTSGTQPNGVPKPLETRDDSAASVEAVSIPTSGKNDESDD